MNSRVPISLHLSTPLQLPQNGRSSSGNANRPPPQTILEHVIEDAHSNNYESVCIAITTDQWKKRWGRLCLNSEAQSEEDLFAGTRLDDGQVQQRNAEIWRAGDGFQRDEVNLTKIEEAEGVIGLVSEWLELDSPDEWVRLDSEIALRQELTYASYLNMNTVILPCPKNRQHVADYARAINGAFSFVSPYLNLSVRLPVCDPILAASRSASLPASPFFPGAGGRSASPTRSIGSMPVNSDSLDETWEMWDVIRTICGYNSRLNLTLDLSAPLAASSEALARWHAEPIRHLFVPTSAFVSNNRGYPVLPKAAQIFIREAIKHRPNVILSGTKSPVNRSGGEMAYQQYIRYLEKTSPSVVALEDEASVESFASGYWDYLQAPLQPLMDNLQSTTYEVFERDPVKYAKYEQAIYLALCDHPEDQQIVLCVAGAGRGPLVAGCLRALARSARKATIYAVEKNPSAFVTLQERRDKEWGPLVNLVFGDMRTIKVPEPADILISELLGSFGDNELSPECLDGAMRFLKPSGISIPSSYTAHLAPLSSSKLYSEATGPGRSDLKAAETPYVVMFQAVHHLSAEPQECWEFEHPRADAVVDENGLPYTNSHNNRAAHLKFSIPHAGILHGLAGYFEACLYGEVGLSTHPHRKDGISPNMLSWFPIFFPFKDPLYLPARAELDVSIWRLTDKKKVWYEWYAESFYPLPAGPLAASLQNLPPTPSPENDTLFGGPQRSESTILFPAPGSPLVDAPQDAQWADTRNLVLGQVGAIGGDLRLKIGQTTLHNPAGRSSWIGL